MNKSWTDDAWEDFEYWMEQDKKEETDHSVPSSFSLGLQSSFVSKKSTDPQLSTDFFLLDMSVQQVKSQT